MKNIEGRVALVTGAGSGIGRATALALAHEGARVAITDVDEARAAETARMVGSRGGLAEAFTMDVTDREQIRGAKQQVRHSLGAPSILVNNAGIAVGAYFQDTSPESWERIVSVNLMGVVRCCGAFLPEMLAGGRGGHIVNIASMLGYVGARGVSAYCATKFGVVGFSECLRAELFDQGIGVSAVCPGVIHTSIIADGILESSEEDVEEKRKVIEALYARRNYSPGRVARSIITAIRRNRAVVPVTPEAWILWYLARWAPWAARWLGRKEFV